MSRKTKQSISDVIEKVCKCLGHPYWINKGQCDDFALMIVRQVEGAEHLWGNDVPDLFEECHSPAAHHFVLYNGLYYDAECPEGVETPKLLPYYLRQKGAYEWELEKSKKES